MVLRGRMGPRDRCRSAKKGVSAGWLLSASHGSMRCNVVGGLTSSVHSSPTRKVQKEKKILILAPCFSLSGVQKRCLGRNATSELPAIQPHVSRLCRRIASPLRTQTSRDTRCRLSTRVFRHSSMYLSQNWHAEESLRAPELVIHVYSPARELS
jgi:hypothetical protein